MIEVIGGAVLGDGRRIIVERRYGRRRCDGAWMSREGPTYRFNDPQIVSRMVARLVESGKLILRDGLVRARYR